MAFFSSGNSAIRHAFGQTLGQVRSAAGRLGGYGVFWLKALRQPTIDLALRLGHWARVHLVVERRRRAVRSAVGRRLGGHVQSLPIARAHVRKGSEKRQNPGDDLFSREAALSVSSALESLTSVFGMGTGMASPPMSPGSCCWIVIGSTVAL